MMLDPVMITRGIPFLPNIDPDFKSYLDQARHLLIADVENELRMEAAHDERKVSASLNGKRHSEGSQMDARCQQQSFYSRKMKSAPQPMPKLQGSAGTMNARVKRIVSEWENMLHVDWSE
jgi:hypothetical protein